MAISDDERFKLRYGPYKTPRFQYGKEVQDEWRGEVTIVGLSSGRIPWPVGRAGRNKSLVVYRGLAKAIRQESIVAVAYWWGVTTQTVTKWRRRLGITGQQTKGTSRLRSVYFDDFGDRVIKASRAKDRDPGRLAKISAAKKGKKRPKHVIEAMRKAHLGQPLKESTRQKMSETHKRRGTRPPWIGAPWSAEERGRAQSRLCAASPVLVRLVQSGMRKTVCTVLAHAEGAMYRETVIRTASTCLGVFRG